MSKIFGALFMVLALCFVMMPAAPVHASLGEDCTYDEVKWENNEDSWFLYLNNWGRTPLTAMSRLAGLAHPDILHDLCNQSGNCPDTRVTGCDIPSCEDACACAGSDSSGCCIEGETCNDCITKPTGNCCCCWGISLAFANKGWGGCDVSEHPRVNNDHPNHYGNSNCGSSGNGGDWGISGCPHPECCSDEWCLPDNLCSANL